MKAQITLPLPSDILVAHPTPKYDRRLSDKILAAYAHAYEIGERAIAARLRVALEEAVRAADSAGHGIRRTGDPLHQADLMREFVDARQAYRRAAEREPPDPEEIERTSREMLEAYRIWSDS